MAAPMLAPTRASMRRRGELILNMILSRFFDGGSDDRQGADVLPGMSDDDSATVSRWLARNSRCSPSDQDQGCISLSSGRGGAGRTAPRHDPRRPHGATQDGFRTPVSKKPR